VESLPPTDALARRLAELCSAAGAVVMEVYATDFEARAKGDSSPVTEADERAEALLHAALADLLPGVTVVAEEAVAAGGLPEVPAEFLLVDPLDGTREFLSRNGDFTVNVALVREGAVVCGAVHAPARSLSWYGGERAVRAACEPGGPLVDERPVATREYPAGGLVAVASKSHLDDETAAFLDRLPLADRRSAGSSLKLCLVATGEADVYPRFGPTMEWDIAAGHAVLQAAGGQVLTPDGAPFRYGKVETGLRNGPFVAWGRAPL
jgi:3'(2'), 5'-bisphosphate nucleotidase